jgi:hypothetical protein
LTLEGIPASDASRSGFSPLRMPVADHPKDIETSKGCLLIDFWLRLLPAF